LRTLLALLLTTTCFAQDRVQTLAEAIAKAEGHGRRGTLPSRLNNPGDLKAIRGYIYPGQVGIGKGGHAKFRTDAEGWAALEHQLDKITDGSSRYSVNLTLQEFGNGYAGNWRRWSRNVAKNLGVQPDTYLFEVLDVPPVLDTRPAPLVFCK
jgi:hypothetical protein